MPKIDVTQKKSANTSRWKNCSCQLLMGLPNVPSPGLWIKLSMSLLCRPQLKEVRRPQLKEVERGAGRAGPSAYFIPSHYTLRHHAPHHGHLPVGIMILN